MKLDVLKDVNGFEWDKANIEHIALHFVYTDEAEEVFSDPKNALIEDVKHSAIEKRYIIVGKTEAGRLLYQVFAIRGEKIRILSSRDVSKKKEKALYE